MRPRLYGTCVPVEEFQLPSAPSSNAAVFFLTGTDTVAAVVPFGPAVLEHVSVPSETVNAMRYTRPFPLGLCSPRSDTLLPIAPDASGNLLSPLNPFVTGSSCVTASIVYVIGSPSASVAPESVTCIILWSPVSSTGVAVTAEQFGAWFEGLTITSSSGSLHAPVTGSLDASPEYTAFQRYVPLAVGVKLPDEAVPDETAIGALVNAGVPEQFASFGP